MTSVEIMAMLKANLQIINTSFDTYLGQLLRVSISEIEAEGITMDVTYSQEDPTVYSIASIRDCNLVVMYAAYLYRKRVAEGTKGSNVYEYKGAPAMPKMLRLALNNRLFGQKMRDET